MSRQRTGKKRAHILKLCTIIFFFFFHFPQRRYDYEPPTYRNLRNRARSPSSLPRPSRQPSPAHDPTVRSSSAYGAYDDSCTVSFLSTSGRFASGMSGCASASDVFTPCNLDNEKVRYSSSYSGWSASSFGIQYYIPRISHPSVSCTKAHLCIAKRRPQRIPPRRGVDRTPPRNPIVPVP